MIEETQKTVIEEGERQKILKRLERSHTERFRMLMQLIKLQKKIEKATIIHKKI